jgi:aminopeptidase YwaD
VRPTALLHSALIAWAGTAAAHSPPLLAPQEVAALANELSGETAMRNLEGIALYHRQRGSQGFHSAAELVADRARAYGLSEVQILKFPADGRTFYGTQLSRQAWDAEQGDLTEVGNGAERTLASYEAQPVALAEDSESADVTAELVDVGQGT